MYENMINQNLYIREIVDPDSKKHYLIYIYLSSEKYGCIYRTESPVCTEY